jgi:hypothetical protein
MHGHGELMQQMLVKDDCAPSGFGFGHAHKKTHRFEKAVGLI